MLNSVLLSIYDQSFTLCHSILICQCMYSCFYDIVIIIINLLCHSNGEYRLGFMLDALPEFWIFGMGL